MGSLVKMDLRRLFLSKVFYISMAVMGVLNMLFQIIPPIFIRFFAPSEPIHVQPVSGLVASPFSFSFLLILMVISIVSFSYADIANGFIKNIAGQVRSKSSIVYSKFIVVGIHNCIFMLVGVLTCLLGAVIISGMGMMKLETDNLMPQALFTFFIKWMLSMAISAILMFFTTAVKNKTVATVIGVILGTGALGMVYFGLNQAIENIFHVEDVEIQAYVPDQLINSVNAGANIAVVNAIVVAIVCTVLFLVLTVKVFNNRDVK